MDSHLEQLQGEIASALDGISGDRLLWHPAQKWCTAEVLEHLYLTYTGTAKGFERVVAAGRPLAQNPTWKQRAGILLVIGLGYMPSGREAPPMSRPRGVAPDKVLAEIGPKIAQMDEIITSCEQKFGPVRLLDHPILGPLSGAQWRKFHLVHGRHHLRQIRRLREMAPR